ncbi:MAG: hypothetical protein FJW39_32215 [Acidobacteria bacterium]|nr:hypothetical protein [Acidobacteriota bacterium]
MTKAHDGALRRTTAQTASAQYSSLAPVVAKLPKKVGHHVHEETGRRDVPPPESFEHVAHPIGFQGLRRRDWLRGFSAAQQREP